jgi:hypothetical protein
VRVGPRGKGRDTDGEACVRLGSRRERAWLLGKRVAAQGRGALALGRVVAQRPAGGGSAAVTREGGREGRADRGRGSAAA